MPNRGLNKKQFLGKLEGVPYLRECPADWSDARLFIDDMYKNQRFFFPSFDNFSSCVDTSQASTNVLFCFDFIKFQILLPCFLSILLLVPRKSKTE